MNWRCLLLAKGFCKIDREAALNCSCKTKKAAVTQDGEALKSPFGPLFPRLQMVSRACELLVPFTGIIFTFEASEIAGLKTEGV